MTEQPSSFIDQRVKRWNKLMATPAQFQVDTVRIIESDVFCPQTIKLDRATAFIGMHGTGKSLLLRSMEASFGHITPVYSPPYFSGRDLKPAIPPMEGVVEVSLKAPSGPICRTVDLSRPPEERKQVWEGVIDDDSFMAWYTDPIGAFAELNLMHDDSYYTGSLHEITATERELSSTELNALNNILGRRYDNVTIRSVRIDEQFQLPFISARLGSKVFDNYLMSQGELWVHYIGWFLEHEEDKGHLALIDEPESFLSAQGRRAFIDQIAWSALRNDRQVVIGTHSPEILSRFPLANIRMCIPGDSGIQIRVPRSVSEIHDCVGIEIPIRGLVLVEDELAGQLLVAIFSQYDTALTRELEIVPVGGASQVVNGGRILYKAKQLACFAVLDGDQQLRQSGAKGEIPASILYYLPGVECPEDQLIKSALEQVDWLAEIMGIYADQIFASISTCRHLDHQYRLGRIAQQLGYSVEALTRIFIRAWLRRSDVAEEAQRLVTNIRNGMPRVPL